MYNRAAILSREQCVTKYKSELSILIKKKKKKSINLAFRNIFVCLNKFSRFDPYLILPKKFLQDEILIARHAEIYSNPVAHARTVICIVNHILLKNKKSIPN